MFPFDGLCRTGGMRPGRYFTWNSVRKSPLKHFGDLTTTIFISLLLSAWFRRALSGPPFGRYDPLSRRHPAQMRITPDISSSAQTGSTLARIRPSPKAIIPTPLHLGFRMARILSPLSSGRTLSTRPAHRLHPVFAACPLHAGRIRRRPNETLLSFSIRAGVKKVRPPTAEKTAPRNWGAVDLSTLRSSQAPYPSLPAFGRKLTHSAARRFQTANASLVCGLSCAPAGPAPRKARSAPSPFLRKADLRPLACSSLPNRKR